MKKILSSLLMFLCVLSMASAAFMFDFGPHDPLYASSYNDTYTFNTGLHFIHQLSSSPEGNNVMVKWNDRPASDPDKYQVIEYRDWSSKYNNFLHLQIGTGFSFLRLGWPEYFVGDLMFQAAFNSVFSAAGGTDVLGFDGTFFFGGEARIMDMFVMKFGLRHYSGHTGDEILQDAVNRKVTDTTGKFEVVDYVRDNMLELGIGYAGIPYAQVFFSFLFPPKKSWWAPYFHMPDWVLADTNPPQSTEERDRDQWAVRGAYGNGYGAYILQLDVNLAYPFAKRYEVYSSLNMKFHQDGMTNHTLTPHDDTDRWEMELTASVGFTFKNAAANKDLSIEFLYHDGRFPVLNFFWKRSQYIAVGIAIR